MTEVFVRAVKPSPVGALLGGPYNNSKCYLYMILLVTYLIS